MVKIKSIELNKEKDGAVVTLEGFEDRSWVFPIKYIKDKEDLKEKVKETVKLNKLVITPNKDMITKFNKLKELVGVEV